VLYLVLEIAANFERLKSYFALPGTVARVSLSPEAIAYLHTTFWADLRRTELVLYEVFESLRGREGGEHGRTEELKSVMRNP
jgi:hypothetical protein